MTDGAASAEPATRPLAVVLDKELDTPFTHGTLASLPQWLRADDTGTPKVRAVGGPGWPERLRAALASQPRAVLLSGPTPSAPETVRELAELAGSARVPVVVDSPWALHPAVADALPALREAVSQEALVEIFTAVDKSPVTALLDQLALIRTLLGAPSALRVTRLDEHGHGALGEYGNVFVSFSGARSAVGTTDTRLVLRGAGEQWRIGFGDPRIARPADVVRIDDGGEHRLPTLYETAHRAAWRHTHAAANGAESPHTLHHLAADLALLPVGALGL
ncbi:hypothetical protein [Streptomyces sp. MK37H]|uniref:hypothetical protein n=1 Tax=Streptomyces sp. MK37H TaxID=2699117 RepID=UPI001B37086F|nr:hypothetical protein [Streptomyces sp. MK37H]MBP8533231.1 hypothetical protein [Streptomyces sp. MK37H]